MEKEVKDLRLHIDGVAQLVKSLPGSPELTKCHNGLMLGKAWLGKVLGELGTKSPYPKDGSRHTVEDIEKTADKVNHNITKTVTNWKNKNHIEKVDYLRQEIGNLCKKILPMSPNGTWELRFVYEQQAHLHLSEARFWLGWELERIKKEENK